MEYQRQIANATKFVFGLSAYNMGVSQSIFVNLQAILEGETPEKMGEVAQQQLFLALDQIRNQESLITRIKENENFIEKLNLDIIAKQKEIDEINKLDIEQNRRISENAQDIDELEQQDAEQDKLIAEGIEKDKVQDAKISENAQDIDTLERQDEEQDIIIADITREIDKHKKTLDNHSKQDKELQRKIQDVSKSTIEMIYNIKSSISENTDATNKNFALIENNLEKQIGNINETLCKFNDDINSRLVNLSTELKNTVAELKGELENQTKDINTKIANLEKKIVFLDRTVSKRFGKLLYQLLLECHYF